MKNLKIILITLIAVFAVSYSAAASDFGWTRDFNLQAQADPSGFKARIATRFNLGDIQVRAVLSNFDSPSDAYIVLRLGEISGRSSSYTIEKYRRYKGKGWGALAKSLGIKPGSKEFHALKHSQDLYDESDTAQEDSSRNKRGMMTLLTLIKAGEGKKSKGKK